MMRYDFRDLINRHSVQFEVLSYAEGSYEGGVWKNGTQSVFERIGAIIPLSERKIYQSGGTYSSKDRNLYMISPLASPLKGLQVRYKGDIFNVEEEKDYSDYSDAYIYILRWVSSFD